MAIDVAQRRSERESEGAYATPPRPVPPLVPVPVYRPPRAAPRAPAAATSTGNVSYRIGSYTKWTGDPAQGAVPAGEYNVLESLLGEFEALIGYQSELGPAELLELANHGVQTLSDLGRFAASWWPAQFGSILSSMPWAKYGLTKDEYASAASTFGTEYKKITGQDISPDALQQAFQNPRDPTGGLLNASQYQQQLMNDANIQKQYGWVKYGLDYSAWTQQKLSMRTSYGRDINDAEAATILQYNKSASGANLGAVARVAGQQAKEATAGVAGSLAR